MLGYLKADKPGVLEPVNDGWHNTGDIVTIDRSGFVTIKGRAKRFAKIGGEMVSLAAVEDLASKCWPGALSAAAALPDARKGQRLVLLTQEKEASRADFLQFARAKSAADVMIRTAARFGQTRFCGGHEACRSSMCDVLCLNPTSGIETFAAETCSTYYHQSPAPSAIGMRASLAGSMEPSREASTCRFSASKASERRSRGRPRDTSMIS